MNGFTLIEVLLSIAIISILAGIGIPVYQSLQVRNDLDVAAVTIAQNFRRAQILSQAMEGDTTWGISIQNQSITLFQGASYAGRNQNFDEVFDVPNSIALSGTQEVVFAKFSGEPYTTGTVTLTTNTNETRNITINTKGMVSY